MIARSISLLLVLGCVGVPISRAADAPSPGKLGKLRALIIDGQNNHDWKTTTPRLKKRSNRAVDSRSMWPPRRPPAK